MHCNFYNFAYVRYMMQCLTAIFGDDQTVWWLGTIYTGEIQEGLCHRTQNMNLPTVVHNSKRKVLYDCDCKFTSSAVSSHVMCFDLSRNDSFFDSISDHLALLSEL